MVKREQTTSQVVQAKQTTHNNTTTMSDKIIRIAIQSKFPTLDIDTLMELLHNTPNVVIATEKVLGIYERPVFPETLERLHDYKRLNCTVIEFNEYTEEIKYTYDEYEEIVGIFKKDSPIDFPVRVSKRYHVSDFANEIGMTHSTANQFYERRTYFVPRMEGSVVRRCTGNTIKWDKWKEHTNTGDMLILPNQKVITDEDVKPVVD